MIHFQCSFRERIRLLQLVGGFPAMGTPQLRECSRILDVLEPKAEESAAVGLSIDIARDQILWDEAKLAAAAPVYELNLETASAQMLLLILEKVTLHPLGDRWVLKLADLVKRQIEGT